MEKCPPILKPQYQDNLEWIRKAEENQLVVGSQARILYVDAVARSLILKAFSEAIEKGEISGPVTLSRDHHDVSGADSPYRETASVRDGSMFCADMSVQNFVGTAIRGATWVALHNGGGTGWGEVLNGGFGVVLVGTKGER
jgi:urocanate hydratase